MKRVFLTILPLSVLLTGCVVYSPTPNTGQYGFTYDYSVPVGEGAPRPLSAAAVIAAEAAPEEPPRVPPIYSEIPEPTPRIPVAPLARATVVPPQPVIQEAAGAEIESQAVAPAAVPPPVAGADVLTTAGGGIPFDDDDTNNIGTNTTGVITNTNNTVGVITHTNNTVGVITNTNNTVGVITNTNNTVGVITNPPPGGTNQAFGAAGGATINEAAGAGQTNLNIPNRLPPAPRLSSPPTSPRATQTGEPVSSPTPTTPLPQQNPELLQRQQQQQQQAPQQQQQQAPAQPQPAPPPQQAPGTYAPVAPR